MKTKKPVVSCTLSVGNGWVLHGIKASLPLCVRVCSSTKMCNAPGIMSFESFFLLETRIVDEGKTRLFFIYLHHLFSRFSTRQLSTPLTKPSPDPSKWGWCCAQLGESRKVCVYTSAMIRASPMPVLLQDALMVCRFELISE